MQEAPGIFSHIIALIRVLVWPATWIILLLVFRRQVAMILGELPMLLRRLISGKALGLEIQLRELETSLPAAEQEARYLELHVATQPDASKLKGDGQ